MKKQSKIPTFTTDQEEAEFWDTHSVTDFLDELKPVTVVYQSVRTKPQNDAVIHVKVSAKLKQRLDQQAKAQASNLSHFVRLLCFRNAQLSLPSVLLSWRKILCREIVIL